MYNLLHCIKLLIYLFSWSKNIWQDPVLNTLIKKFYWINRISFQKHVYHGFKSICRRISNIFIGSCSIFLWIHSIHAFGKKCFWFNSIFFLVYYSKIYQSVKNDSSYRWMEWNYNHPLLHLGGQNRSYSKLMMEV